MAQYQYKTKDGQDYILPGIGATHQGVIDTDQIIENSNFVLVSNSESQPAPAAPAQPQVQPANAAAQQVAAQAAPVAPVQPAAPVAPAPQIQTNTEQK